jgi:hypothetical protein
LAEKLFQFGVGGGGQGQFAERLAGFELNSRRTIFSPVTVG